MYVAICDDDRAWSKKFSRLVRDHADRISLELEVICFENEDKLFSYEGFPIDALFMDIQLGNRDGIDVAEQVNKKWEKCQIIYLTNYLYYATEIYNTRHVFFALKEQFSDRIGEIFQKLLHVQQQSEKKLVFSVIGGSEVVLAPDEILYFERVKRVTVIKTVWGEHEVWTKLRDIMDMLPELDFVRCHNSFIVYFPAVRELLKDSFIMNDGSKIIISRSHVKETKEAFARWALTQTS
ncbi:MAG: response regulator transcription factor [Clostridia bacterium]|nr:response regulator transcription factor [Clostridia bacterium]NCC42538.1 response regulator transcription factor [Clostridia bacterium]